jgi:Mg2+ and Co2+ transporter CorA
MNIGLPGGGDPAIDDLLSFAVVIGVMLLILVGMAAFFRSRRWL